MVAKNITLSGPRRLPSSASSYTLCRKTGQGPSASVFHAICEPIDEEVAVKVIDLEWFQSSLEPIAREIQIMKLSSHPNIVPLSTAFVHSDKLWLIMPLVTGGSVRDLIHDVYPSGLPESLAVYVLWSLLKGIDYLHRNKAIHRDIKASNIFFDAKGNVMLSDCGIVQDEWEEMPAKVGTPSHMAPELLLQTSDDHNADIWALGITAIELAQGMAPNSHCPAMSALVMTLKNPPRSLDAPRARVFSTKYNAFVECCLKVEPKERPTSAQLLRHPLFANGVEKPKDFEELMTQLPPVGSQFTGFQKMLHNEHSKLGNTARSSGQGWDFGDDVRAASSDVLTASVNDGNLGGQERSFTFGSNEEFGSSEAGTEGLTRSFSYGFCELEGGTKAAQYRDGENTTDETVFVEAKGETKTSTFLDDTSSCGEISISSTISNVDARPTAGQSNSSPSYPHSPRSLGGSVVATPMEISVAVQSRPAVFIRTQTSSTIMVPTPKAVQTFQSLPNFTLLPVVPDASTLRKLEVLNQPGLPLTKESRVDVRDIEKSNAKLRQPCSLSSSRYTRIMGALQDAMESLIPDEDSKKQLHRVQELIPQTQVSLQLQFSNTPNLLSSDHGVSHAAVSRAPVSQASSSSLGHVKGQTHQAPWRTRSKELTQSQQRARIVRSTDTLCGISRTSSNHSLPPELVQIAQHPTMQHATVTKPGSSSSKSMSACSHPVYGTPGSSFVTSGNQKSVRQSHTSAAAAKSQCSSVKEEKTKKEKTMDIKQSSAGQRSEQNPASDTMPVSQSGRKSAENESHTGASAHLKDCSYVGVDMDSVPGNIVNSQAHSIQPVAQAQENHRQTSNPLLGTLSAQQLQKPSPIPEGGPMSQAENPATSQTPVSESEPQGVPQNRAASGPRRRKRRFCQRIGAIARNVIGACLRFLRLRRRDS